MDFEISIPTDDEGYILLQCPLCNELFKIKAEDYQDENIFEIHCPSCGLVSDNYLTDDIKDLALVKAKNYVNDQLYNSIKKMEKNFNKGIIEFKVGKKPKSEFEKEIDATVGDFIILLSSCCHKRIKISKSLQLSGYYCPFCGVRIDEI